MWFIPISSTILYNNNNYNITTKFTFSSCSLVWNYVVDRDLQRFYSSSSFFYIKNNIWYWDLFIHAHNVITHTRILSIRISNSGILFEFKDHNNYKKLTLNPQCINTLMMHVPNQNKNKFIQRFRMLWYSRYQHE